MIYIENYSFILVLYIIIYDKALRSSYHNFKNILNINTVSISIKKRVTT